MSLKQVKVVVILCLIVIAPIKVAFTDTVPSSDKITEMKLRHHVNVLCADRLEGRLAGTQGEKLAAQYIAKVFHDLGLEPAGDNGTYFQRFKMTLKKGHLLRYGINVLAELKLSSNTQHIIVVGAHLDHLGHGEFNNSRALTQEAGLIHAGADDNASGVASLLEVAAQLSEMKKQGRLNGDKNIIFAAWSGEEIGILGSSYFVKKHATTSTQGKIDAAINLDMVGHLRKHVILQSVGSSQDWPDLIRGVEKRHTLSFVTQSDPYLPTDSTAFYLQGVPALNIFTGAHDNYHTPRDTPQTLNYKGITTITAILQDLLITLEKQPKLRFQAIQKPRNSAETLHVYLGTIPDYGSTDITGVKLAGVAKNSPAERAGIKPDDVLSELAGRKIHNIYDYAYVLNTLRASDPIKFIVLRGKYKVTLTIIPEERGS